MTEQDLPMVRDWRNSPSIRHVMFSSEEIGYDEHRSWFQRVSLDRTRRLLIAETSEGALGFVQFSGVDLGGVSDWGFYVRPGAAKGAGRVLGIAALDHAFIELQLHKVCGQALVSNQASIHLHKRLGFQEEGFLRDQHRASGAYISVVHFGILRSEWSAAKTALLTEYTP